VRWGVRQESTAWGCHEAIGRECEAASGRVRSRPGLTGLAPTLTREFPDSVAPLLVRVRILLAGPGLHLDPRLRVPVKGSRGVQVLVLQIGQPKTPLLVESVVVSGQAGGAQNAHLQHSVETGSRIRDGEACCSGVARKRNGAGEGRTVGAGRRLCRGRAGRARRRMTEAPA
jgi:hypothetical protein